MSKPELPCIFSPDAICYSKDSGYQKHFGDIYAAWVEYRQDFDPHCELMTFLGEYVNYLRTNSGRALVYDGNVVQHAKCQSCHKSILSTTEVIQIHIKQPW